MLWMGSITTVIGDVAAIIEVTTAVTDTTVPTATSTAIISAVISTGAAICVTASCAIGVAITRDMLTGMGIGMATGPTDIARVPKHRTGTRTVD